MRGKLARPLPLTTATTDPPLFFPLVRTCAPRGTGPASKTSTYLKHMVYYRSREKVANYKYTSEIITKDYPPSLTIKTKNPL